jgi:hypothetical protein
MKNHHLNAQSSEFSNSLHILQFIRCLYITDNVLYKDTHIMDVVEHSNLTFRGTLCNVLFHTSNTSERTVRLCTTPELLDSNFKSAILCIFKSRGFPEPSNLSTLLQPITLLYSHTYPCSLAQIIPHCIHWPRI